jgi:hypothetical protein
LISVIARKPTTAKCHRPADDHELRGDVPFAPGLFSTMMVR